MVSSAFSGTITDDGGGSFSWGNVSGAGTLGGLIATVAADIAATTNTMKLVNFGFNLPSSAVINGIRVVINKNASQLDIGNGRYVQDDTVKLLKAGVATGSNEANTSKWDNTGYVSVSYGGKDDLWGTTWTYSDINDSTFGLQFIPFIEEDTGNTTSANVDWIHVYIYWNYAPGAPVSIYKAQGFQ